MNFEPTPDAELASAALDNEVTNDDRARLNSNAAFTAEYASYQLLSAQINDVTVPSDARERSLLAAMSVFDELQSAAEIPTAPVVSMTKYRERRQQQYRWLGAVAAVSLFAVGGFALFAGRSPNDKAASVSETLGAPSAKLAPAGADVPAAEMTSNTEVTAAGMIANSDAAPSPVNAPDDSIGLATVAGPADVSAWASAPSLNSEAELIAFVTSDQGNRTADTETAQSVPNTDQTTAASFACAPAEVQGIPVVYLGRQVYAVRDDQTRTITIFDPANCSVEEIPWP
jgi:hypothetical protein